MENSGTRVRVAWPETTNPLNPIHPDYAILKAIDDGLCEAAGGKRQLGLLIGRILRRSIDRVVQTPKTNRLFYEDLESTEKTYIGTCVEIDLRSELKLPKGPHMDLLVAGQDTDVKCSRLFGGWMIPEEAYGKACVLITADDSTARFHAGIVVAKVDYLRSGKNKDKKLGLKAKARVNIRWLFQGEPYPPNFWLGVSKETVQRISAGSSGNERMTTFVREVIDRPFSRKIVEDVGAQDDFMRRIRADSAARKGTRDVLLREGVLVVHGHKTKTRQMMKRFGIDLQPDQFISHRLKAAEYEIARQFGYEV